MKSKIQNQLTIAVDLGGTWMRAASVGKDGDLMGPLIRKPTGRQRPPDEIIGDLVLLVKEASSNNQAEKEVIAGVALGVPTVIDPDGRLIASDNLPTLGGFALAKEIERRMDGRWTVRLFNDAACFTVGEWRHGIGKGKRFFCGITIGTGIGMRIIDDGRVISGCYGMAGEIWKSPLEKEHVENFVSGAGLTQLFKTRTGRNISGEDIQRLAEKGDSDALSVFAEFGYFLGKTLAWIVNCFDPDAIVLGGSVAHSFVFFEQPMRVAMAQYCSYDVRTQISASILWEKASIIGASILFDGSLGGEAEEPCSPWRSLWRSPGNLK